MNFNAINVTMFGIGAILIYAALKDSNPKDVITNAFSQSNSGSAGKPATRATTPQTGNNAPRQGGSNFRDTQSSGDSFREPFPSV